MFRNTWNIVIEWFKDRSERSRLVIRQVVMLLSAELLLRF